MVIRAVLLGILVLLFVACTNRSDDSSPSTTAVATTIGAPVTTAPPAVAETTTTVELPPGVPFHRGDPNSSGTTDLSDGITVFNYLFLSVPETLPCNESADANNDGTINIADGIYILNYLFADGPEPPEPGPPTNPCGRDPESSASDFGCEVYENC